MLFPYAKEHVESFLKARYEEDETKADIKSLCDQVTQYVIVENRKKKEILEYKHGLTHPWWCYIHVEPYMLTWLNTFSWLFWIYLYNHYIQLFDLNSKVSFNFRHKFQEFFCKIINFIIGFNFKAIIAVTLVVTDFMTNVPKWFYWSLN